MSRGRRLTQRLGEEARGFLASLRDGALLWKLAPIIPAIAVLPEFAQHVVEIRLGMFASHDAFTALASDAARQSAGSIKMAGFVLSILMAARFWANRSDDARFWSLAGIGRKQVLLGLLVQVLCSIPGLFDLRLPPAGQFALSAVLFLVSLPGMVLMIGGLLGDRTSDLKDAYRNGWGQALRMALFTGPVFALLQPLHHGNHVVALGKPATVVWGLMTWDALLVGLIATLVGTGFHHGYRGGR
ncbi:hypothetical protein [Novosphingobium sp. ZW T3_23]|uniref:hypothetical protein n=1 Tax=Novosphingobium sp. ZW T3_23 TaxID=3378084 RepID=UPI003854B443